MISVFVRHNQEPKHCRECPFLNEYDECILQNQERNREAEDFETLYRTCPVMVVERDYFVPMHEQSLVKEIFSKDELARMYVVRVKYTEDLEAENRELKQRLKEVLEDGKPKENY